MKIAILTFLVSTQLFAQSEFNGVEITNQSEKSLYFSALAAASFGINYPNANCSVSFSPNFDRIFVSKKTRRLFIKPDKIMSRYESIVIKIDPTLKKIEGFVIENNKVKNSLIQGNLLEPLEVVSETVIEVIDCITGNVSYRKKE